MSTADTIKAALRHAAAGGRCESCGCTERRACTTIDGKPLVMPCSWRPEALAAGRLVCTACPFQPRHETKKRENPC